MGPRRENPFSAWKTLDGFLALFSAHLRHTSNDQMMERPDDLKVDWASPVVILDNGDHMEALVWICQWFYYHAQGPLEMLITIVSKPIVLFFCHTDRKEGRTLPNLHRHRFRREEGSRAHMLLPHPQKTHKNSTNSKQRYQPRRMVVEETSNKRSQINSPSHGLDIDIVSIGQQWLNLWQAQSRRTASLSHLRIPF